MFRDCCIEMSNRGHSVLAVVRINSQSSKILSNYSDKFEVFCVRRIFGTFTWWTLWKFARILDEFDPDIVVTHIEGASQFITKIKHLNKRRWPLVSFVPMPLSHKKSKAVDTIIPHTKQQATVEYHTNLVDPKFSDVVPVFSRFTPVPRVKRKTRIQSLIAVGRLVPIKGFKFLIEAMRNLNELGYHLKLNVVGVGSEMSNLIQQRDALGLTDVINFAGQSHKVNEHLEQADLFILPSVSEPFGIVLLEAMASGLPIVATKTNGPMEILDESSAVLVDTKSADALSQGIHSAIHDLDATYLRACKALEVYRERYTADVVIPKYIDVFQQCIEARTQGYAENS